MRTSIASNTNRARRTGLSLPLKDASVILGVSGLPSGLIGRGGLRVGLATVGLSNRPMSAPIACRMIRVRRRGSNRRGRNEGMLANAIRTGGDFIPRTVCTLPSNGCHLGLSTGSARNERYATSGGFLLFSLGSGHPPFIVAS